MMVLCATRKNTLMGFVFVLIYFQCVQFRNDKDIMAISLWSFR